MTALRARANASGNLTLSGGRAAIGIVFVVSLSAVDQGLDDAPHQGAPLRRPAAEIIPRLAPYLEIAETV